MVHSIAIVLLRVSRKLCRIVLARINISIRLLTTSAEGADGLWDKDKLEEVKSFLLSLDQADPASLAYLKTHADRLARTITLAPQARTSHRCLELGSYMHVAPALNKFVGYHHVTTAALGPAGTKITKTASSRGTVLLRCDLDLFDVERDSFPYPDEHFELVLACELLEHLQIDPMHMFFEIHRVLELDGCILLSTPNCASWASLEQCLWMSANPYTYSLYPNPLRPGRDQSALHIREYTPNEVRSLLEAAGFSVEVIITLPGRAVE